MAWIHRERNRREYLTSIVFVSMFVTKSGSYSMMWSRTACMSVLS